MIKERLLMLLVPAIIFIVGAAVFFILNLSNKNLSFKKVSLYGLVFALLLGAGGSSVFLTAEARLLPFITVQVYALLLGIVFNRIFTRRLFTSLRHADISGIFLSASVAGLGAAGFSFLYNYFSDMPIGTYMSSALIPFALPLLVAISFKWFAAIPPAIYKLWYFPLHKQDLANIESGDMIVINLKFQKSAAEKAETNFKLATPADLDFGSFFHSFICQFNERFHQEQIQFLKPDNSPDGWYFRVTNAGQKGGKMMDPDMTLRENQIHEGSTIFACRAN